MESNSNDRANTFCGGWAILLLSLAGGFFDLVVSFLKTPIAHPVFHETVLPIWIFIPSIAMVIIAIKYLKIAAPFKSALMTALGWFSIVISICGLLFTLGAINPNTRFTLFQFNDPPREAPGIR